ncbi:MAG: hypothetical protein JNL85_10260 [Rubrivivax sp.]|nr:hypothetical protein [Rubrivivax sp.]
MCTTLIAAILFVSFGTARSSEQSERNEVKAAASVAYASGDLSDLIRQHTKYSDFLRERTSSGASKMLLFFDGLSETTRTFGAEQLQTDIARTRQWTEAAREEPLPYILHASALLSYALYVRGGGYANTVPPQAWKTYTDYVNRATNFLLQSEGVASRSTSWHVWLLNAMRNAGAPPDAVLSLFEAGVARNPGDFRLYQFTLHYFLPKWYGNAQAVDSFILRATKAAPPEFGLEIYARLYSGAEQDQFGRTMYSQSLVDWERMKSGLTLWNRRFPTAWNKNIFAYHACIAGDKLVAKELLADIGSAPEWAIWQPNAQSTFLTCSQWASDPDAEPSLPPKRSPAEGQAKGSALR